MFKFIKFVGKLVVKSYHSHAKRLVKEAKGHADKESKAIIEVVHQREQKFAKTEAAAKVATDAAALSKFFS